MVDEFQGAYAVHRLTRELPYRDFQPYKTVLGYYLQLPVLELSRLLGRGIWVGLLSVKVEMALITALTVGWSATQLRKTFRPGAILVGTVLLLSVSTFLERSAALRVDMLTALAGLVSLVFLIRRRPFTAGVLAGLSFLISQKGGMYSVAGIVYTAADGLTGSRRFPGHHGSTLQFAGAMIATLALYYGIWIIVAPGSNPLAATAAPVGPVLAAGYSIRLRFWLQTLIRNPFFYGLGFWSVMILAVSKRAPAAPWRSPLAAYAGTIVAVCAWYRQPWPYFFVLLLPTLWVAVIGYLHLKGSRSFQDRFVLSRKFVAATATLGIAFPLALRVPVNLRRDASYQRDVVTLASEVVEPGQSYLAGAALLYDRHQEPAELRWLDYPHRAALGALSPRQMQSLLARLEGSRMKAVIYNYRLRNLPDPLLDHLNARFLPVYKDLAVYAPTLSIGDQRLSLDFGGEYRLISEIDAAGGRPVCSIDGDSVLTGDRVLLGAGPHSIVCSARARLLLRVDIGDRPLPGEGALLFPESYTY